MRDESIFDSMKHVAEVEPGFWTSVQKAINKVNEKKGTKFTMFDMLTDAGKSPLGDGPQVAQANGQSDQEWQSDMHKRIDELQRKIRQDQHDMDMKYLDLDVRDGRDAARQGYHHGGPAPQPAGERMYKWAPGPGDKSEAEPSHINAREDAALGDLPDVPYKGTGEDDRIAMLSPLQQTILAAMGGSGNINPQTGLKEFDDGNWGDSGDGSSGAGDWGGSGGDGNSGGGDSGGSDWGSGNDGDMGSYAGDMGGSGGPGADWGGSSGGGSDGGGDGRNNDMDFVGPENQGTPDKWAGYNSERGLADLDETGSGGKKTDMGLQSNPMGLAKAEGPAKATTFLDSINNLFNINPENKQDPMGLRANSPEAREKAVWAFLGPTIGAPMTTIGGAMWQGNLNSLSNAAYGRNYSDLTEAEKADIDAQNASQQSINDPDWRGSDGAGPGRGGGGGQAPSVPGTPSFLNAQRPAYWAFEGDPLQQRTGAATEALYGRPIFRSPEAQDYYRRLAHESVSPIAPPTDIDYQYLTDVLGRARPGSNTVQAFLDSLNY